jgi:hypothetical protein
VHMVDVRAALAQLESLAMGRASILGGGDQLDKVKERA